MRTPNTECCVCAKPLYRRPFEFKKWAKFCCVGCRSAYFKTKEVSPNLELGRQKGTNHLEGIPKNEKTKQSLSKSLKKYCKEHPEEVKERGKKTRGEKHYLWKGGTTNLNQAVRRLDENRKWARLVKNRDGRKCRLCGSQKNIEADHILPLSLILEQHNITNRDEARECEHLWDINNGMTLCRECHYKKDNKKYRDFD